MPGVLVMPLCAQNTAKSAAVSADRVAVAHCQRLAYQHFAHTATQVGPSALVLCFATALLPLDAEPLLSIYRLPPFVVIFRRAWDVMRCRTK